MYWHMVRRAGSLVALLLFVACGGGGTGGTAPVAPPAPAPPPPGSGGSNDPSKLDLPHVILVSFDGFRHDYLDLYDTPAFDRLAAEGVRAAALVPVYPTVTFPNHYSIATGLVPSNHGIVANAFPSLDRSRFYSLSDPTAVGDGTWYGGEPAWVAAESSGIVAAAYYFVGTEADIAGIRPTFWRQFDASVPAEDRVTQVIDWLNLPEESRPHFITLYFGDVDRVGHQFGPLSAQMAVSVSAADAALGQLMEGVRQSPASEDTYIIAVSDHGMAVANSGANVFVLENVIDLSGIQIVGRGSYVFLFFDSPDADRARQIRDDVNASWASGQAYVKGEAPETWRIGAMSRYPDVIVQANDGSLVVASQSQQGQLPIGLHGWEPDFGDMHGIFVASGPRLPAGTEIAEISALDIYPLLLALLEIPLVSAGDGDADRLPALLQD